MTPEAPPRERMTYYQGKMRHQSEVDQLKAATADTPPPQGPAPTPAAAPDESPDEPAVRQRDGDAAAPFPMEAPQRPEPRPAAPSSTVTVPLIEGIAMEIANVRGTWYTAFVRDGVMLTEDATRTNPAIDRRAPGRLTAALSKAVPALSEKAIKSTISAAFDAIRSADDGKAMVSEAVAKVIGATERVERVMTDPPEYVVYLDGEDYLEFSAREIATEQPVALNVRWESVKFEKIRATQKDFGEIIDYWFEIAERVDPPGTKTLWESVAEDLQTAIAAREPGTTPAALLDTFLYQEPDGPLWISNRIIKDVMKKSGKEETDNGLSRFFKQRGDLIANSKSFTVSGISIRAWGFRPDFMPEADSHSRPAGINPEGDSDAL